MLRGRLSAFGAQVTGVRRTRREALPAGFAEAYTMDKADGLLPQADIVVNCLPSTPETEGFLTRARLLSMKKGALLVNVGRGSFVKTDDLVFALEKGFLGGAVLDVLETEPLEESSLLWDMENVLITPHIAGPSFEGNVDVQSAIWASVWKISTAIWTASRFGMWSTGRRVIDTKSRKKSRLPCSLDFVGLFGNCGEQRAGKGLGREVAVIGPPDVRGDDLAALLHDDAVPPIMPAAGIL